MKLRIFVREVETRQVAEDHWEAFTHWHSFVVDCPEEHVKRIKQGAVVMGAEVLDKED